MATVHYTAKVKNSRLLELPEEAQELGLKPGEEVTVSVDRNGIEATATFPPNEQALQMMCDLVKLQEGMKETDGLQTDRLLREARAGGLYGFQPTE